MRSLKVKNKLSLTTLIGIPIILVGVLTYFFASHYEPKYQQAPFDTIIYSSDRYSESRTIDWHKIDISSFSIEVPCEYHFYFENGIHGGKVGGFTDSKDTISFVHGMYYFDACEGIVMGETIGTCDTLKIIETNSRNLMIVQTDSYISAFSRNQKNDQVFKAWANLNMNRDLLFKIFDTIKLNY